MFAQHRCFFQIEIIQRNDAVYLSCLAKMAHGQKHMPQVPFVFLVGHVKDIVKALARPLCRILKTE